MIKKKKKTLIYLITVGTTDGYFVMSILLKQELQKEGMPKNDVIDLKIHC